MSCSTQRLASRALALAFVVTACLAAACATPLEPRPSRARIAHETAPSQDSVPADTAARPTNGGYTNPNI